MKIASAMLVGTTALALAFSAGSAFAKARHHYRHHHARLAATQVLPNATTGMIVNANNPAKRYPAHHDANMQAEATLYVTGNNPTKRYKTGHDNNARMEATLSASGNNPVKRYPGGMH
jgi:hypothetical protein